MRTFKEINALRERHGLTRKAVYEKAKVDKETWRRLDKRMNAGNTMTLTRLSQALDELIEAKAAQS